MIRHTDFDGDGVHLDKYVLPDKIEQITVCHDGGRLEIYVNNVKVYDGTPHGTRDCEITLDKELLVKPAKTKRNTK
jgi:hypothetical protein